MLIGGLFVSDYFRLPKTIHDLHFYGLRPNLSMYISFARTVAAENFCSDRPSLSDLQLVAVWLCRGSVDLWCERKLGRKLGVQ